jgi:hypothetical protein
MNCPILNMCQAARLVNVIWLSLRPCAAGAIVLIYYYYLLFYCIYCIIIYYLLFYFQMRKVKFSKSHSPGRIWTHDSHSTLLTSEIWGNQWLGNSSFWKIPIFPFSEGRKPSFTSHLLLVLWGYRSLLTLFSQKDRGKLLGLGHLSLSWRSVTLPGPHTGCWQAAFTQWKNVHVGGRRVEEL